MLEKKNLFPLVTVDVALFTVIDDSLRVLLVQRALALLQQALTLAADERRRPHVAWRRA